MDTVVAMKTFPELLEEAQSYLRQRLSEERRNTGDPSVRFASSPVVLEQEERARADAARACGKLFEAGDRHGLTEKEVTLLLMRKVAPLLRPGLMSQGCGCPTCRQRRVSLVRE